MKNVLIAGGNGFIGNYLTSFLKEESYNVSWLCRNKKLTYREDIDVFFWNPKENIIDEDVFEDIDIIINLCGSNINKKWTENYKKEILESRTIPTNFLIEKIKELELDISHFINFSAIGIYPYSKYDYFNESTLELGEHFLSEVCKEWEHSANKILGIINLTIFRVGVVLSNNEGLLKSLKKMPYTLGDGRQWISWIHILDLCRMVLFSIENNIYGVYNATSSNAIKQIDLIRYIRKSKKDTFINLFPIPKFVIKLLYGKEFSDLLLKGQNISNLKIKEKGFEYQYEDINKIL